MMATAIVCLVVGATFGAVVMAIFAAGANDERPLDRDEWQRR